jgi:hypothetical protein
MTTMPQEELIRSQLGPDMKKMSFRLGERDWAAWYAPAPSERLRSRVMAREQKSSSDYYEAMEAEAKAVAAETTLRAANIRFFLGVGEQQRLFWAIPGLPALDVIELAKVGTHNGAPDEWRLVRDFVSGSLAGIAFDVVFADAAGLDLRFISPVSTDVARRVDKALLDRMEEEDDRLHESYLFMHDRATGLHLPPDAGADPRGGGYVPSFITATQSLRLWWD